MRKQFFPSAPFLYLLEALNNQKVNILAPYTHTFVYVSGGKKCSFGFLMFSWGIEKQHRAVMR